MTLLRYILLLLTVLSGACIPAHGQAPGRPYTTHDKQLEAWLVSKPDTVVQLAAAMLSAATYNSDTTGMLRAVILQSKALIALSHYQQAQALLKTSITILEHKGMLHTLTGAKIMAQYAKALLLLEQVDEATGYYLKTLPLFEKYAGPFDKGNLYIDMAEFCRLRGEKANQATYLDKALAEAKLTNDAAIYARYYNRMAETRTSQLKMDSSIYYSNLAILYARKAGDKNNEAWSLNEIGFAVENAYPERPNPYYAEASALFKQTGNVQGYTHTMLNDARALMNKKRFAEAKALLDSCRATLEQTLYYGEQEALYYYIFFYYRRTGNMDSALYYQQVHAEKKYAQTVRFLNEKIAFEESKFDNAAKQQIINKTEHELQAQQEKAARQARQRNAVIAVALTLVLLAAALWIIARRLRSSNAQLKKLSEDIKYANTELTSSLHQKDTLLSEVHHRVKNNLQVLISLLELQAEKTGDEEAVMETISRVRSMGLVHEMIYRQEDITEVNMQLYTQELYEVISMYQGNPHGSKAQIDCSTVSLKLEQAMPMGIIMNELLTNSWKHARKDGHCLLITVSLTCTDNTCRLAYSDNGPGLPENINPAEADSIGLYLLRAMARQIGGELSYNWNKREFIIIFSPLYGGEEDIDSGGRDTYSRQYQP